MAAPAWSSRNGRQYRAHFEATLATLEHTVGLEDVGYGELRMPAAVTTHCATRRRVFASA